MTAPHVVQQVIKYSDGTETVINYRGIIVDGELITNEEVEAQASATPKKKRAVGPKSTELVA